MGRLLGTAGMANPYAAVAGAVMGAAQTATSSSAEGKFQTGYDNSGWNINFGSGSITSSAEKREALSQWVGIASGIAALLVILKVIKG